MITHPFASLLVKIQKQICQANAKVEQASLQQGRTMNFDMNLHIIGRKKGGCFGKPYLNVSGRK